MQVEPAFGAFEQLYGEGKAQLLYTRLVADLETPVSAFLKLAAGRANSFLLESVEGGAVRGRYSMIGLQPDLIFRAEGSQAAIARAPDLEDFVPLDEPPLQALRTLLAESRVDVPEGLPSMGAGVFGYLGYDMVRQMERLPNVPPDSLNLPDAVLMRPQAVVVFDAVKDELTVVTPVRPTQGVAARAAYETAVNLLTEIVDALDRPLERGVETADVPLASETTSNTTPEAYKEKVRRAKEYIAAGDIFQVVLSQRFETAFPLPAFSLYRALRRVNPAPFLYFLDFGGFSIVGSSPEILVRARAGKVTIRPIAGTRPRGATSAEDKRLGEELLADPKELAEHLMLLDLGRNDVGRVAEIGSVHVTDKFFLEHYSQVMHIVSNVEGDLRKDCDAIDALAGGFPAGTVSGAPKIRAMQIIDELEESKRGPYAGCVGYFTADGDMDTCIVLRTAVVKDDTIYVQAGAGIVADSDPDSEQAECVNKAKALFRAAEEARRFANQAGRGQ
ncbi:anthranilate synthase component 1 [Rhodopseudomonas julia]|uniref:Anthranilate synthase component 1 n=1 Tax=Rhodopseudomonas julia TaxID=200617 RepID=A0ABU0CBG9_9BRAD|nr:anthranilate synthase component I [Rhodopseudomonas julia]MDQ0327294.1 anthranilate synthase component 1 [Rhodopseudomonas julia]